MKAILKKLTQPDQSKFDALVDAALALYRELSDASNQFHDARDDKLSARGYLTEALRNARTDQKKIEALDKLVARLPEDGNEHLFRFLSTATQQAAATRMDKGVNLRPPVGNLHRLVGGDSADYVGVIVESNMLGSNPFELVALAALRATRDNPENFGVIDDWDKFHAEQADKRRRLDELYAQIAEAWKDAPIEFEDVRADGYAKIVLAVAGVTIPLGDPNTLGERLCVQLA